MEFEPNIVVTISDPSYGRLGYLIIDSSYNGHSVGGLRIMPNISLQELIPVAQAKTKKYGEQPVLIPS